MTDLHEHEQWAGLDPHIDPKPPARRIGHHVSQTLAVISLATVFGAAAAIFIRLLSGR